MVVMDGTLLQAVRLEQITS